MSTSASRVLKLGIPAGSLQEATVSLFRRAGYNITISSRSYYPTIDDDEIECLLIRAHEICELTFSKVSRRPVRWVLAVPTNSPIETVKDLQGKRIATEAVGLTKTYLAKHGVTAKVEF